VRKAGERLRITVQLIDSRTSDHIWSDSYDRELKDVFAVQSEISETVAGALKVQLLSSEKERLESTRAVNPEGYTLYLKGRFYWNERTKDNVSKALKYFERAIAIDPNLAVGYSGLADCYAILLDFNWMAPSKAGPLALKHARKALELDSNLAEAHASLGLIIMNYSWDFVGSAAEFKRAIELRPNYAPAHHWYAVLMLFSKKYLESYLHEKQAAETDPQSMVIQMGLAVSLARLGETDEALRRLDTLIQSNPDFAAAHDYRTTIRLWRSEYDKAVEEARGVVELDASAYYKLGLAETLALAGRQAEGQEILGQVLGDKAAYVSPVAVAGVEFALGHWDDGFKWLSKGLEERDNGLLYFRSAVNPAYANYRSDPRWKAIESELGLQEDTQSG
jgi:tetratricopeptide (TPR) repeat protein